MVRYLQFYQPMVLNSLVVSLIPVAILSLQVGNQTANEKESKILNNVSEPAGHLSDTSQSQLDTERQGVLRNMWLTSARLSTAAALTISLNMIIKVNPVVSKPFKNI